MGEELPDANLCDTYLSQRARGSGSFSIRNSIDLLHLQTGYSFHWKNFTAHVTGGRGASLEWSVVGYRRKKKYGRIGPWIFLYVIIS